MCGRPDFTLFRSPKRSISFLYSAVRPMPKGGRTKGPLSGSLVRPPVGSQPPATSRRLLEGRQGLQSSRSHSGDLSCRPSTGVQLSACAPTRRQVSSWWVSLCRQGFLCLPKAAARLAFGWRPRPRPTSSAFRHLSALPGAPFDVLDLAPDCLEGRRWFVGLSSLPPRFFSRSRPLYPVAFVADRSQPPVGLYPVEFVTDRSQPPP